MTEIGQAVVDVGLSGDRMNYIMRASGDRLVDMNVRLDVIFREFDYLFPDRFPQAAYLAFSQRRWWKRVWVVQELSVSCDPVFLCGDLRISYEHLCSFVDFLSVYGWSALKRTGHVENPFDITAKEKYEKIAEICSTTSPMTCMLGFRSRYQRKCQNKSRHGLLSILKKTVVSQSGGRLQASNERDLIFGLLGIADDQETELQIPINYKFSYSRVCRETTMALLENGNLEALSLCQKHLVADTGNESLPSWVCTWHPDTRPAYGDCTQIEKKPFSAGGNFTKGSVTFHDTDTVIIKGIRVGTVSELSAYITPGTVFPTSHPELPNGDYRPVEAIVNELRHLCRGLSDEDFSRVLSADSEAVVNVLQTNRRLAQPEQRRATAAVRLQRLRECRLHLKWERAATEINLATTMEDKLAKQAEFMELLPAVRDIIAGGGGWWIDLLPTLERRAWRTEGGRVGLGPMELDRGDVVVVLFGSPLPLILRQCHKEFVLVGEAYVHGAIDGELLLGQVEVEEFRIK
jgi:hypothetical protein